MLSIAAAISVVLLLGSGKLAAQSDSPDRLAFVYTHQIEVNCQDAVATQSGWIDVKTGSYGFDYVIKKFIPGYRWEVASPVTLATSSAGPIAALQIDGASNLLSLTGGALKYSALVTAKGPLMDLRTRIFVERRGDVVYANLHTRGKSDLPDLTTLVSPMVVTQTPNPGGGFTERGVKVMFAADGTRLESEFEAVYTGVDLPGPQVRTVDIAFVDMAPDRSCGRLNLTSEVRPATPAVAPAIDIARRDASTVRLHWQGSSACAIERAESISGPWVGSDLVPQCVDGTCEAFAPTTGAGAYYRLRCAN
ncbi:MAG: hypothetical protein KF833_08310 [Verrucomicrobiae bacterium]|nr:hypothetical protein [Verrucomicrobiae bacterium]